MKSFVPPVQPSIPLTREKYDSLKRERVRLTQERDAASERVKIAREMGDLSENGAYHYGKQELASYSRQLREVQFLLKFGVITESTQTDTVQFGSRVIVRKDDKEIEYQVVSQYESDPKNGRISVESPIGKALLGKKVGDTVKVVVPAGELQYTITNLR